MLTRDSSETEVRVDRNDGCNGWDVVEGAPEREFPRCSQRKRPRAWCRRAPPSQMLSRECTRWKSVVEHFRRCQVVSSLACSGRSWPLPGLFWVVCLRRTPLQQPPQPASPHNSSCSSTTSHTSTSTWAGNPFNFLQPPSRCSPLPPLGQGLLHSAPRAPPAQLLLHSSTPLIPR